MLNSKEFKKDNILIIAELGNTHEGHPEKAHKLIEAAFSSKADAVKFQIFFGDELVVQNHPRCDHFKKMEMKESVWNELIELLEDAGSFDYARILVQNHMNRALGELDNFADCEAKQLILQITEMMTDRHS